jgi:hypothetical protein
VSYLDDTNANLKYATCIAGCTTAANWQTVAVDAPGVVGYYTSLAVDGSAGVHVAYQDATNSNLKYATCPADCATAANWDTVTVDSMGNVGAYASLAVDGSGRVHVSYRDVTNTDLEYATCATACATADSWRRVSVDAASDVGSFASLAVDGSGRVHVSYFDSIAYDLKYIE